MRGYAGKFLEVDLSVEKTSEITFDNHILRRYIGGRGLASKILWDRLGDHWETIDPLGSKNILLVLTGPLTGFYPGARICISGKSPLTNGIVGSTVGCEFPVELKCAGYDGIIIMGRAAKPTYLFITDSKTEIKNATHLWGKDAKETLKVLNKETRQSLEKEFPKYGEWKEPGVIYIGPAGENMVRMATIMSKWTHAAGFGGYGAVMGSKNLKAIAVKGTGPLPEVEDLEKVQKLIAEVCKRAYKYDSLRRWGTAIGGYEVGARRSSQPVKNWQGEWHDMKSFGVDKFEQRSWVKRYWGDFGCPTTCMKISRTKIGPFKGAITDGPDYELQAYLGTNLGIFTPEENIYLSELVDDLGLCGIQTGNVLGFAGELYQRGILTSEDLDGIELRWGDVRAFATLIEKIARREGIGNLLADGTYRAALRIKETKGVDVMQYAIVAKGMAIGAHGMRSGIDWPAKISYACSVQAGDHGSIALLPVTDEMSELSMIIPDSGVFCHFNCIEKNFELIWGFFEAVTGWRIGPEEWYRFIARRILHIQRAALLVGGPELRWVPRIHDDNPPRFYDPLPSGPYAGKTVDKAEFEREKKEYYESVGWDENGIPKSEELERLGLERVREKLKELSY